MNEPEGYVFTPGLSTRLIFNRVQVRVQEIFASSSSKNFFTSSSSSSAKTIEFKFEFAALTVSIFINATRKEFWFLLILVLTDLYNYFFNIL